jgi:hypothetical protein
MKRFANVFVAVGFALAGSAAFADQAKPDQAKQQPVQMSDAQLDTVAAGQVIDFGSGLVDVTVGDVTVLQDVPIRVLNNSVNGNTVQIPVAANVNAVVGVLGNAAGLARQFGRQN